MDTNSTTVPHRRVEYWAAGPAKWAAVVVLGLSSVAGLVWSMTTRVPHPRLAPAVMPPDTSSSARGAAPVVLPQSATGQRRATPAITRTINVNTATSAELELLPGIGPALAQRIIDDRVSHGPFKTVNDLDRVKGIGPKTLERLRPLVRVE